MNFSLGSDLQKASALILQTDYVIITSMVPKIKDFDHNENIESNWKESFAFFFD